MMTTAAAAAVVAADTGGGAASAARTRAQNTCSWCQISSAPTEQKQQQQQCADPRLTETLGNTRKLHSRGTTTTTITTKAVGSCRCKLTTLPYRIFILTQQSLMLRPVRDSPGSFTYFHKSHYGDLLSCRISQAAAATAADSRMVRGKATRRRSINTGPRTKMSLAAAVEYPRQQQQQQQQAALKSCVFCHGGPSSSRI